MAATVLTNRDRSPLTREQLARTIPSVFAEAPHESRSNRYLYVPTVHMLDAMEREGFQPVWASQSRSRDASRADYTKHMIRLRRPGDGPGAFLEPGRHHFIDKATAPIWPEIVLTNSHDGSSSVQMSSGLFRLACTNGLIVSEGASETFRMQHTAKWRDEIIEGTYRVIENLNGPVAEQVHEMQARELSEPERVLLAEHAATLRWRDGAPVNAERLLAPRRRDDGARDAWTTLNVLQENTIRGGIPYRLPEKPRETRHTRPVSGIDDLTRLNRGIWAAVATLTTGNRIDLARDMLTRLTPEERQQLALSLA